MDLFSITGIVFFILWYLCGFIAAAFLPWARWKVKGAIHDALIIPALLLGPLSLIAVGIASLIVKVSDAHKASSLKQQKAQLDAIVLPAGNQMFGMSAADPNSDTGTVEFKKMILFAITNSVSDIFLEPLPDNTCSVRMHIAGALQETSRLNAETAVKTVTAIKTTSSLDITDNRRPQNGGFNAKFNGTEITFKVATAGTHTGERVAVRIVSTSFIPTTLEQLALAPQERDQIRNSLMLPSGLIIISGPAKSGKTTTYYTFLRALASCGRSIISIEERIKEAIPGVSQMEVVQSAGINTANLLSSALQQYTQVIAIDEIRDPQTANMAIQAANSGHLVITSMTAATPAAVLQTIQNYGISLNSIAGSMQLLINQRFIRTCCQYCKQTAQLPQEYTGYFTSAGLPANRIVAASSCPRCDMTGYAGRKLLFDIMPVSQDLRQFMAANNTSCIDYINAGHGKVMMVYKGLQLASIGETAIDEVTRTTFDM